MEKIKLYIPGSPEYETMIRLVAGSACTMSGFDIEATEDVKTALFEACKLVSCHGENCWTDEYEIEYAIDSGYLQIKVEDICQCHSLEKNCKPCSKCPEEGEIGKVLIRSLMDEVEAGRTEDDNKFVRMVKKI